MSTRVVSQTRQLTTCLSIRSNYSTATFEGDTMCVYSVAVPSKTLRLCRQPYSNNLDDVHNNSHKKRSLGFIVLCDHYPHITQFVPKTHTEYITCFEQRIIFCESFMCQFHSMMNQTLPSLCNASLNEVTTGATTTSTETITTTVLNDQNKDWLFRASISRPEQSSTLSKIKSLPSSLDENQKCCLCLREHIISCDVVSNQPVKARYFQLKLRGEASVTSPSIITAVHQKRTTSIVDDSGRISSSKPTTNGNNRRLIFLLSDDPWDCPFSDSYWRTTVEFLCLAQVVGRSLGWSLYRSYPANHSIKCLTLITSNLLCPQQTDPLLCYTDKLVWVLVQVSDGTHPNISSRQMANCPISTKIKKNFLTRLTVTTNRCFCIFGVLSILWLKACYK